MAVTSKFRNWHPIIDQNGLSSGGLLFAPTKLEIEQCPIILDAKEKIARIYVEYAPILCAHQATEPVKAFVQHRYYVIGLLRTRLSLKYRCFLCCRSNIQKIQPIMAHFMHSASKQKKQNFHLPTLEWTLLARFILKTNKAKSRNIMAHFYMPRYARSPFANMSRFKHRHLPQCTSTVDVPNMLTYFVVER